MEEMFPIPLPPKKKENKKPENTHKTLKTMNGKRYDRQIFTRSRSAKSKKSKS